MVCATANVVDRRFRRRTGLFLLVAFSSFSPLSLPLAHFYLLIRLSDSISQHARTARREESDTEGGEQENFFR